MQTYEVVVVGTYSYVADESVDEIFKQRFPNTQRSKRTFATNRNKLTVFIVRTKKIDPKAVKTFESFLAHEGFVKLYSTVYSDTASDDYAHFFTIKLNLEHFADMKDLFISKLEAVLGKKILVHEDIYYYIVSKTFAKSQKRLDLLDKLTDNPILNTIIVV